MRTIFVLFDSLNRTALGAYGGTEIATPNFDRFARRAVTFDNHYAGSLPCMPARRDMHTGRLNFLHRPWGPLEPFDNSFVKELGKGGVYTHLVTDHHHYFETGGNGYAQAFDSWDFVRGQEYDPIRVLVEPPVKRFREIWDPRHYPLERLPDEGTITREGNDELAWRRVRHSTNTLFMKEEADYPTAKCFAGLFDFLDLNGKADNVLVQLECFDPHEPFCAPERFRDAYRSGYNGRLLDWPVYERATNSAEEIAEIRGNYAALTAMADEYFGRLLDWMDAENAWQDTCLILTTDHGFLLGEHEWWGKNKMPYYEEISHIPLIVWHPDAADQAGTRRDALTQTMDLMPTFLDLHGMRIPPTVTGRSILPVLRGEEAAVRTVIFGMFGGPIGITDGRYAYYHYPVSADGEGFSLYTVCPENMSSPFPPELLAQADLAEAFNFTKGARLLRVPMSPENGEAGAEAVRNRPDAVQLFDLETDPRQEAPLDDPLRVDWFCREIAGHMALHDAPRELFTLYGLDAPSPVHTTQLAG